VSSPTWWFDENPDRIRRLQEISAAWVGTPFFANGTRCQVGVSCQTLVASLFIELGFLPQGWSIPMGPVDWGRAHKRSRITGFLDSHPALVDASDGDPWIGDILGFKVGGCVHHLGVLVDQKPPRFIHCLQHVGTQITRLDAAPFAERHERTWRPIVTH
jgi:hypothetical protein